MTLRHYIALIRKKARSDYGVSFPDLPGCVSAGTTPDEARRFAEEALTLHVAGLVADGEPLPDPSTLEAIMIEPNNRDGLAVLVPVKGSAPRIVRVNITVPEDVLATIDAYAQRVGMNRSGFLVHAAKRQIEAA